MLTIRCPNCGHEHRADGNPCPACGKLTSEAVGDIVNGMRVLVLVLVVAAVVFACFG